ncbi:hypothetical protein XENTR_v10022571 [Xenopus tropicalis]|nr:hypothetical protein XENTR_v10022571 [Xenopus tropicalis]
MGPQLRKVSSRWLWKIEPWFGASPSAEDVMSRNAHSSRIYIYRL